LYVLVEFISYVNDGQVENPKMIFLGHTLTNFKEFGHLIHGKLLSLFTQKSFFFGGNFVFLDDSPTNLVLLLHSTIVVDIFQAHPVNPLDPANTAVAATGRLFHRKETY
jgi:hypothetical protein